MLFTKIVDIQIHSNDVLQNINRRHFIFFQLFCQRLNAAEFLLVPDFSHKNQNDFPVVNVARKIENMHFDAPVAGISIECGPAADVQHALVFFP